MITVVCWKYFDEKVRRKYKSEYVNTLFHMIRRNYSRPFKMVCLTDNADGLDPVIEAIPLPDFHDTVSEVGRPNCYRRLWIFSKEAIILGKRLFQIDIDVLIRKNIDNILDREEEVVCWHDPDMEGIKYSGGMILLNAGARPHVYESFDPKESPKILRAQGYIGSDQAWLSYCLYPHEATWSRADGIYRFRNLPRSFGENLDKFQDIKLIQFPGVEKPWKEGTRRKFPWTEQLWY